MALSEFLLNVKTAAGFLAPATVNRGATDSTQTAEAIQRADLWLTPYAVHGFDLGDFRRVPAETREELCQAVAAFLQVARQVPANEPATLAQVQAALPPFLTVVRILDPYIRDPERADILEALEQWRHAHTQPSDGIVGFDVQRGTDSTGDPAVWFWVVMEDVVPDQPDFVRRSRRFRDLIGPALQAAAGGEMTYVRIRARTEQPMAAVPEA